MSKISRADSKARFRTGMYPTQADFENLHDSYVHKDDTIPLEQVGTNGATVVSLLNQKANSSHTHEIADVNGLQAFITKVNTFLDTVDASDDTINRWKEIEEFLTGITDTETLTGLLQDLKAEIEGNIAVDSELSATSEKALQNKVLFDELRMTDGGATTIYTIDSVTNDEGVEAEFTRLDANTLQTAEVNGQLVYVIPFVSDRTGGVAPTFVVSNASGKVFVFSNVDNVYGDLGFYGFDSGANTKFFDGTNVVNVDFTETAVEGLYSRGFASFAENSSSNITGTSYYYFGEDALGKDVELNAHYGNVTIDGTVIKSLKTKIAELEARLAAVPTNYIEFATDMSAYASAPTGKIVAYFGTTTNDFRRGLFYEKTASGWQNIPVSPVIQ